MKILLIGSFPPPIGGTTVLLKQLADELANCPDVQLKILDINQRTGGCIKSAMKMALVLKAVLAEAQVADVVSFHASLNGSYFGALLRPMCRVLGKPLIFRSFGAWDHRYEQAPAWGKFLLRHSTLKADAVLMETKAAVEKCRAISGDNVYWYSNSRPRPAIKFVQERTGALRFLYVGHVTTMKGISDLSEAAASLCPEITVDVYGPLREGIRASDFTGKRVRYKGVLAPDQVFNAMRNYDVLVMPSRRSLEGYPGVIIEAFMVGMPVIATKVGAIPEIVDESSGILIDPGHPEQLAEAMRALAESPELLAKLELGASAAAERFDSKVWSQEFVRICREVSANNAVSRYRSKCPSEP